MKYRALLFPAALGLSMTAATAGGWAVITVEDLPTHFVAGQPTELRFKVRQHGMEVVHDLKPQLMASLGKEDVRVAATNKGGGVYAASITVPTTGQWTLNIDAGWHGVKTKLLPITAVAAGARPLAIPERYRGKQLFVAKGCVTCHMHSEVPSSGMIPAGPDLTGKKFDSDYLKLWL